MMKSSNGCMMKSNTQISEEDLRRYSARFIREAWKNIISLYDRRHQETGLTRADLAQCLGVHRSIITKRLKGTENVTLEILSDMARALNAVPHFSFECYEDNNKLGNYQHTYELTMVNIESKASNGGPWYIATSSSHNPHKEAVEQ